MKLALQGCSWYSLSFLNSTFLKAYFLQYASSCFSRLHAKIFREVYASIPMILKMRFLDLSLRVNVEVITIFTLPLQNCISNTKMWSVILLKKILWWHTTRIKVKFFNMTLQSPHKFSRFGTWIFSLPKHCALIVCLP